MPRPGIWNPTLEPARWRLWSGWPASAPGVWQPPQSMMVARYSPRRLSCAEAAAAAAAAATTATMQTPPATLTTILRIGLGSRHHNLRADLRDETFRAYRRSFPVLSGPWGWRASMMDDRKRITTEIRDYLARQRISREQFAHQTRLGKSTVDKLLTGLFSERPLAIVGGHTGLKLRERPDAAAATAVTEAPSVPDRPSIP